MCRAVPYPSLFRDIVESLAAKAGGAVPNHRVVIPVATVLLPCREHQMEP